MESNTVDDAAVRSNRFFYGWYIVIVAFFGHFMATGMAFYIFNAFINPLCEARNWSRTEINAAPGIGFLVSIIATFFLGFLIKRIRIRHLMAIGAIVAGISFASLGMVSQIWLFYLVFVFLSLGAAAISGIVANTVVSNWFVLKRGKALGIANAGISFSGVILPYVAMIIIAYTNLETAFLFLGLMLLILAPVAWLVVKEYPESYGLSLDDIQRAATSSKIDLSVTSQSSLIDEADGEPEWTLASLIRIGAFWKIGIAYGLVAMCAGSIMFQLAPRFIEIGFDRKQAMLMLALTAFLSTCGKYVWGILCDYFDARHVVALSMVLTGVGVFFGLFSDSHFALMLFIICFGFSMGGTMSTHPIITADLFGRTSFAAVYKFLFLFMSLETIGFIIMGLSFDYTGSYNTAFIIYIITCSIAAGLVFSVKRPVLEC
ncbi:MAG: MFS transporter [Desulfobacteraceae bacterium]|jgi:sugar phosphate permease